VTLFRGGIVIISKYNMQIEEHLKEAVKYYEYLYTQKKHRGLPVKDLGHNDLSHFCRQTNPTVSPKIDGQAFRVLIIHQKTARRGRKRKTKTPNSTRTNIAAFCWAGIGHFNESHSDYLKNAEPWAIPEKTKATLIDSLQQHRAKYVAHDIRKNTVGEAWFLSVERVLTESTFGRCGWVIQELLAHLIMDGKRVVSMTQFPSQWVANHMILWESVRRDLQSFKDNPMTLGILTKRDMLYITPRGWWNTHNRMSIIKKWASRKHITIVSVGTKEKMEIPIDGIVIHCTGNQSLPMKIFKFKPHNYTVDLYIGSHIMHDSGDMLRCERSVSGNKLFLGKMQHKPFCVRQIELEKYMKIAAPTPQRSVVGEFHWHDGGKWDFIRVRVDKQKSNDPIVVVNALHYSCVKEMSVETLEFQIYAQKIKPHNCPPIIQYVETKKDNIQPHTIITEKNIWATSSLVLTTGGLRYVSPEKVSSPGFHGVIIKTVKGWLDPITKEILVVSECKSRSASVSYELDVMTNNNIPVCINISTDGFHIQPDDLILYINWSADTNKWVIGQTAGVVSVKLRTRIIQTGVMVGTILSNLDTNIPQYNIFGATDENTRGQNLPLLRGYLRPKVRLKNGCIFDLVVAWQEKDQVHVVELPVLERVFLPAKYTSLKYGYTCTFVSSTTIPEEDHMCLPKWEIMCLWSMSELPDQTSLHNIQDIYTYLTTCSNTLKRWGCPWLSQEEHTAFST
jgi:hypothetical protein